MQDKHQSARERYQDFKDHFSEQRKRMLEDLEFSNPAVPKQWSDVDRKARETAPGGARPCMTFDSTNQYINQVVNDARQNKPGIQVLPVDSGADIQTAQAIEGMIRHIEYSSRSGIAYDTSIDHAARCGAGWIRVTTEVVNPRLNEQEVRIKSISDALSCMISPESVEPDGSDSTDGFVETMINRKVFESNYGQRLRDKSKSWGDSAVWYSDKAIRVCEYYKLKSVKKNRLDIYLEDGSTKTVNEEDYWAEVKELGYKPMIAAQWIDEEKHVEWSLMTGDEIIDETTILCKWVPLVPVYGNVLWIDGKRHVCGLTRQLMDGQRARNFERTAHIEMIAMQPKAPFILPFESVEAFEDEWSGIGRSNQPYLPYNALDSEGRPLPAPQRLAPPPIPSAFIQGAEQATSDMQAAIGMYKSNLGAPSNAVSGRAKMQDQREGDTATYHYVDNQRRAIEHVARIIVNMIPQYYNEGQEVRTLGMNGDTKTIRISKTSDSKHNGNVPIINPSTGTYDVRVKAGPAYATLRQEASEALTEIVGKNPAMMAVLGPTWARMQDWPESEKVAKLLMLMAPPQVQAMDKEDTAIPPEARSIVAGLNAQIEQMKQQYEEQSAQVMRQIQATMQEMQSRLQAAESVQAKAQLDAEAKILLAKLDSEIQERKFAQESELKIRQSEIDRNLKRELMQMDIEARQNQYLVDQEIKERGDQRAAEDKRRDAMANMMSQRDADQIRIDADADKALVAADAEIERTRIESESAEEIARIAAEAELHKTHIETMPAMMGAAKEMCEQHENRLEPDAHDATGEANE